MYLNIRRPQQPINHNHQQQSTSSQSIKNRPSTPPPRHSLRPMSTDHLQQHASNAIIALDASHQQPQQSSSQLGGSLSIGIKPPYYGGNGKPSQMQQQQFNTKPGWRPDGGMKNGGWQSTTEPGYISSANTASASTNVLITKPGVLWQVTTEPGFVTRVKNKPVTSHNGQKVRPTKKPVIPVTTAKVTTKYYTKSTTSTTSSTTSSTTTISSTSSTSTSTEAPAAFPSRRPNPLLSSLMLLTSTLSDNKISASSSVTSAPTNSVTSTEMSVSASNPDMIACGQPSLVSHAQTRIVGGKNAAFGRWPWQVSVRRTSFFGFSSTHRCGGAILNENWIATAGHCVDDLLTSQIRIRVGDYDFSSVQEDLPHVERAVARKVVHPKYNFFTYEYDLALVQLDQPLQFAPHISPICLPASDDLLIGENATVTGWGRLSEGGTLPSVLQEVQVPILSNDKCKSMFLRAGRHEFIPDIFLCAGHDVGGQDSCQGDSGGPLQVRGRDGRYFLAGIISWGIGCAEANLPGVCTRISKFVPWVLNNVT